MERKAIFMGTIPEFRGKEITITGETAKYYRYRIPSRQFTTGVRRRLSYDGIRHYHNYFESRVMKKNVRLRDVLPEEMFKM